MGNTPNIRFKGYTEDWEQRKLGDLTSLITKGTTPKDKSGEGDVNFIKVENINPDNGEITNTSKISMEEHEGYLKRSQLQENDILFSIAGTLGRVSTVKSSILPANTNQALSIIRLKDGCIDYVTTVLKGKTVEDFIRRNPTIGAQPNLSLEQVNNLEIPFPGYNEQAAIGGFFTSLDKTITLHQRKLEESKTLKKYMLQKMFPQKGQAVPEIRFAGFTDAWEQRKFGDIVDKYEDPVPTPHDGYYRLGIRSHAKGTFHSYVEKGQELETAKMHRVAAGNFIVNITFGWEHAVAITDENDAGKLVSHRFPQYSFHEGMVPDFFRYVIADNNFKHHLWLASPGGAGRNRVLKLDEMLTYKMNIPSEEEQRKIAAFFTNLDNTITLHQRKCDELAELKKYMLQNMFPKKEG